MSKMSTKWDNDEVIQRFREYLKIPSVHPDPDYSGCVEFLKQQAKDLDLPVAVHEIVPKKPVVVITWEGLQPNETSIMLNSHMDVVPVYEEHWTHPPFDAVISEDGYIYARGTQDMKGVGMMHLESIRNLKNAGIRLKRTLHVTFVPDEEIGGIDGMCAFTRSDAFKALNVGFELDESGPSPHPSLIYAFNAERTSRQIIVTCKGTPGHGSMLLPDTAGEKLHYIIDKFMTLRAEEKVKLDKGAWCGDVTAINLTEVSGGVQINVVPESLSVSFDIRIACDVDHDAFEKMIERWCKEAGENVTFEYTVKNPEIKGTVLNDDLVYWTVMKKAINDMGLAIEAVTCPGATDARYVRQQGVPAVNFTPMLGSALLVHCHDETLHVDVYKKGIDIMQKVVEAVANV